MLVLSQQYTGQLKLKDFYKFKAS